MSEVLTKIYALQQRELNEKERQRQQQAAKHQRIVSAFNASGLPAIFNEFRDMPTRGDLQQRIYKRKISELTWNADMRADQLSSMSFMSINGQSSGPRWWCEEDRDSGNMRYCYSSGATGDRGTVFHTPQGAWLDRFIEYLAAAADPEAVADKLPNDIAPEQNSSGRRRLQSI